MATYPILGSGYALKGFTFLDRTWYGVHNGVDISGEVGDLIVAPLDGGVERAVAGIEAGTAADTNPNGNHVVFRDVLGRQHWFTHMTDVYVHASQTMREGEAMGTVGWTGLMRPKEPGMAHVHYVLYDADGSLLDPRPFLQGGEPVPAPPEAGAEPSPIAPYMPAALPLVLIGLVAGAGLLFWMGTR